MTALLQVLSIKQVAAMISLSAVTIWRMRRHGDFPAPIRLSPGRIGFLEADVTKWLEARRG